MDHLGHWHFRWKLARELHFQRYGTKQVSCRVELRHLSIPWWIGLRCADHLLPFHFPVVHAIASLEPHGALMEHTLIQCICPCTFIHQSFHFIIVIEKSHTHFVNLVTTCRGVSSLVADISELCASGLSISSAESTRKIVPFPSSCVVHHCFMQQNIHTWACNSNCACRGSYIATSDRPSPRHSQYITIFPSQVQHRALAHQSFWTSLSAFSLLVSHLPTNTRIAAPAPRIPSTWG